MGTGVGVLLRENGVTKLDGRAVLRKSGDSFAVSVTKKDGAQKQYTAKKIILATGSVPTRVPIPGLDLPELAGRILTSDDLLDSAQTPQLPEKLAILGGGVIGVEMARVMTAFGSKVHIIEALPQILPMLDAEIVQALAKTLVAQKIKISTSAKLLRVEPGPDGLLLHLEGEAEPLAASHLLVAVGRSPKIDGLDDELKAALEPDRRGCIPVDGAMKTKVPGLFAPGDVNGRCMLAHAALEMGQMAAESAARELVGPALTEHCSFDTEFDPLRVPACIYGEPEIGFIGMTADAARKQFGDNIAVGKFPFAANGRAASAGHRDGFVKVVRQKDSGQLLGVQIIGPCASELINEASVVLSAGISIKSWAGAVHGHPTYGEALVEAAADSLGIALHLPPM